MNIAIITGASSGMGQEAAMQLDLLLPSIDEIWMIARRKEKMEQIGKFLIEAKVRVIGMDMTGDAEMQGFRELLAEKKPVIRMLVNCAGYGLMGRFDELTLEEQLGMLHLNCEALTKMTYYCLPYMKKNSRIIQLASSAAFLPQPNFAIYAATKSYVLSFSRALNEELRDRHIYVTAVCPGPVDTEFFPLAERYGTTLAVKKLTMVDAEHVVRKALRDSYHKKPVSVYSGWINAFYAVTKLLPHSLILHIMRVLK